MLIPKGDCRSLKGDCGCQGLTTDAQGDCKLVKGYKSKKKKLQIDKRQLYKDQRALTNTLGKKRTFKGFAS